MILAISRAVVVVRSREPHAGPAHPRTDAPAVAVARRARRAASATPGVALFNLERRQGRLRTWLQRRVRVRAVGGKGGVRIVVASTIAGAIVAIVAVKLIGPPGFLRPLIYVGLPLVTMRASYRALVERFRIRFSKRSRTRST